MVCSFLLHQDNQSFQENFIYCAGYAQISWKIFISYIKIVEEFQKLVLVTLEFHLGYLGNRSTKYWVMSEDDLAVIYKSLDHDGKNSVLLWCNGRSSTPQNNSVATS